MDERSIVGARVRLRGQLPGDAEVRAKFGRSVEVVRGFGGELSEDEALPVAEARQQLDRRFGIGPHWVIADVDNRLVGSARLAPLDETSRSARFAIGIFDSSRLGQGLGTEAAELAIGHGFDELGLERIELKVLATNHRAIHSYLKVGFKLADRIEKALWRDGAWEADLIMVATAGNVP